MGQEEEEEEEEEGSSVDEDGDGPVRTRVKRARLIPAKLSHRMYLFIRFKKSILPQNRELIVHY